MAESRAAWLAGLLGVTVDKLPQVAAGAVTAAGVIGMAGYMMSSAGYPKIQQVIPLDNQSVEIEPGVRTSHMAADGKLVTHIYDEARTSYEAFQRGIKESNNGPCLGMRTGPNKEYEWLSYRQVYEESHNLGSGMVHLGIPASNDSIIGIYSANRPEWVYSEQACAMFSMVVVPLYDTLGVEACGFIINQTSMTTVLCDTAQKAQMLLDSAKDTPSLKRIIMYDKVSDSNLESAKTHNIELLSITEVQEIGKNNPRKPVPPKPSDLFTLCFTSGTTGNPKGVMLTHESVIANISAVSEFIMLKLTTDDIHISYLPLAHMLERMIQVIMFMHGCRIGFFGGSVKTLMEDISVLKPTLFITVPRLLNRIYDKVLQGVNSSRGKALLFNLALNRKKALLSRGIMTRDSIWDKLVFRRIQDMLGGQVRVVLTGSAPLSPTVLDFIRCAFGCVVIEGYGQTECTAGCTMTPVNEVSSGTVGPPLPCNLVKLVDVPEMDYYVKDDKGEICMKGPSVMKGYYKDEERTREAIDADGWLHSGDVGQWMPNGSLRIIDRRKHIFKLAQGEYVAPEKIEGVYQKSMYVAQAFVDGDSLQTYTVGIIVPDPEALPGLAAKRGVTGDIKQLCQNEIVKEQIMSEILKLGKDSGLKGFEQVKVIHLHPEMFSLENGLLTPTYKSKRPALRKYFAETIKELYQKSQSS